ncbi:APC family permease (plasmid) [Gemmobacter fulvus]|uniref:APC family permease n=1 Tax=Gemmobacter fulvus TaxID=2840474 RepID=A0A975PB80_9RHOB|nr:APC family permease [Gemmobacter fulvus]MBT9246415.1 APC family permease [Gemmobacter fulvus]MDQ1849776.1 APC family permease [Gemmobacter fulvus]QWK92523.1 APC family permease [Gemmobacter fulvus]
MSLDATTGAPEGERLARNSIGLAHIVFFVVAAAAPLTAVVGATPVAFAFGNGAGVPGAFVLAGLLYLIFSVGFTAMSRHVGGAGAFYTYIAQGIGRPAGVGGALLALMTYTSVQCAVYALFGVFFSGSMAALGLELPWFVWSLLALVLVHFAGQRNISFSGKILGFAMVVEVLILLLLNLAIIWQGGGPEGMTASSFAPSVVFTPGLAVALVFVVGSFIGFESTAIFGEEAKDPSRTIPRATFAAVLLITGFYAFSTWAIVQFYGPSNIQAAAAAEGGLESLYFVAAEQVLGGWSVALMNVLLLLSLFACVLSFHNTLNRYFFALGREGLLPHSLGHVHPMHGSPARAGVAQSLTAAALLMAFTLGGADPYAVVFSWMSGLAVLGVLAVQIMVCVAIIRYFRRTHTHSHSPLVTLVAPVLALIGLCGAFLLVAVNTKLLTGSDHVLVRAYPLLVVLVGLCGPLLAKWIQRTKPELYNNLGRVFE